MVTGDNGGQSTVHSGRASPYVHLRPPKTLYLNPNLTLDLQSDPKPNPKPNPNPYCLTLNLTLNVIVKSDPNTRPIPNPDQYVMRVTSVHSTHCGVRHTTDTFDCDGIAPPEVKVTPLELL